LPDDEPLERDHPGEVDADDVLAVLPGNGASVLATPHQVVILRDGSTFRPRTGVRSWSYDQILDVSLSDPHRGQARIVLRIGRFPWEAVSVFFNARHLPEAERVIAEIRARQADRPRRP
jgi:predicted deacetylase